MDSSKLETIKEVAGGKLRWSSHADVDGNVTKHPYIKVYSQTEGFEVVENLKAKGIDSYVDLYEDDDGDDDYGRPIIRKIWSVKISNK